MENKIINIDDKNLILLAQGKKITLEVSDREKRNIRINAKEELCMRYKPLILHYGNKAHVKTIRDDIIAHLWLVLLQAIEKYKTDGNVPVEGYFKSCIYYAAWNYYKHEKHKWNVEFLPATEEIDAVIEGLGSDNETPEKKFLKNEQILALKSAVLNLSSEEKNLLKEFYIKEMPLKTLAEMEGVSKQALSYRHRKIIDKLKLVLEFKFKV